ncbi:carbohydrate diacid transcriptional activator CdaR [Streptomyces sp. YIM 121038]|uniref:PucR family transcriptional regulator n=1 Tax=Streptomyces sp. YIM 121038 TaxID=2136401 RepID=UPI00111078F6|nr:helix-turn-helix domain-containing protein [Streptomyces sp. YIM 121038]QCX80199.1 carbohydrate diacid transcriptional activator CdaR [Streptomyces sp. YIM 121038]
MGSLFAELARQAANSARREVETYTREIPEFASLDADTRARAETLEYAVWLRRRTIELSPDNTALTASDLADIASMGEVRGGSGMSLESRQEVLRLHTALMLREINEAVEAQRGGGAEELLRMMSWFAPQGERGIAAYCQGFVTALSRRLPYVEQVALLARTLLAHDPLAAELASAVGMELPGSFAVTVIRVPHGAGGHHGPEREVEALVKTHRVPMVWCPAGDGGGELIALIPDTDAEADINADAPARAHTVTGRAPDHLPGLVFDSVPGLALDLVRDFAGAVGRPCAAGTATAPLAELADALEGARRISRATPLRRAPARLRPHTAADVFVELAVVDVPFVDSWLATVARHLEPGPDLVLTLDAYYHHDMDRGATAAALNVHPRTLDYRLRRVRDLTGLAPGSTRGVRVLSAAVTRHLAVR